MLIDLIHAYKGLQTEKQALEDSLKTFSSPSEEETKEKKEEAKDDVNVNHCFYCTIMIAWMIAHKFYISG